MLQYTLPILAVFVGGIIAAIIDSDSNDLSSTDDKTNEILVISRLYSDTRNANNSKPYVSPFPIFPRVRRSSEHSKYDMRFSLNDFVECTEIDVLMFVKYDGVSSCVTAYSDEACSEEMDLDPNKIYEIGFYRDVIVCNNARDEDETRDEGFILSIMNFVFIVVCIIFVGLVLTVCVKCAQMCASGDVEIYV